MAIRILRVLSRMPVLLSPPSIIPATNAADISRFYDLSVYFERPADIKRLIDFMLSASTVASKIDPRRVGLFGFSRRG